MISRTSAAVTLALVLATPLAAQNATTYRRNPGDTLRYHELTEGRVDSDAKGATSTESRREATAVIAFRAADTAHAWFEAFSSVVKTQGRETATPGVLNRPVPVLVRANGVVEATAPGGPGAGNAFAGFFLQLPDRALAPGVEWADTLGGKREMPDGTRMEMQYIVKYKVVGDTTIGAGKAFVIAGKGEGTEKTTRKTGSGTMEDRTRTTESARIVFSAELGRLLSWDKTIDRTSRVSTRGSESMAGGMVRNPNQRVDLAVAADLRTTQTHAQTHTLIELVGAEQLKAAPAK